MDMIFPRNGTFSPSKLTPIVFAIQNPSLLAGVSSDLYWTFERKDASANETVHIFGSDWLSEMEGLNSSSTDPYFVYWSTPRLDVEGFFSFSFGIRHPNCSRGRDGEAMDDVGLISRQYGPGFFTLKNGTSPPDLVAATNEDTCGLTLAHALNVTDRLKTPESKVIHNGTTCPVVEETPLPTPTPCKVKIDKSAAESISAVITSRACLAPSLSGIDDCPPPTGAASRVLGLPVGGPWGTAMVGLFVSGFLLV